MLFALAVVSLAVAPAVEGRAVAVDPSGRGVWVVDDDAQAVVHLPEAGEPHVFPVGAWPRSLAVDASGRVFVTCRAAGTLVRLDGGRTQTVELGGEPDALVLDDATHRLWVGLVGARSIVLLDSETLEVLARRAVDGPPLHLSLTTDGLAWTSPGEAVVRFISPALDDAFDWPMVLPVDEGRRAWHISALATSGSLLAVAYRSVDTGLSDVSPDFGGYGGSVEGPVEPMVALIGRSRGKLQVVESSRVTGLPDLSSLAWSGRELFAGARGRGRVMVLDRALEHQTTWFDADGVEGLAPVSGGVMVWSTLARAAVQLRYQPAHATLGLRPAPGTQGPSRPPRLVSISEALGDGPPQRAARSSTDATLRPPDLASLADLLMPRAPASREIAPPRLVEHRRRSAGPSPLSATLQRGRRLFFAAEGRISFGELSCNTCHPDGRTDGLTWRLRGTRRNTPVLAGRLSGTAPYNWLGSKETLEDNLVETIDRLGGTGLKLADRAALAEYLQHGLHAVTPGPDSESSLIASGREVFHRADVGCDACHPADADFTDGQRHAVGTLTRTEERELTGRRVKPEVAEGFDTPSLKGLIATAPYFHNGAVATLDELIDENGDRMGNTSHLSADERRALLAYLRSL